jgi:cyanophycinase-like exopeptidase
MNKLSNQLIFYCLLLAVNISFAQQSSYTSYFSGDKADVQTPAEGVCVMMGGASENDTAMKWFLHHSGGGDIVVLRASGSDGYNDYMYSELGANVNSVETIVFNNVLASRDPYVINQIRNAEGLWLAGGDQWMYYSFWKGTAIDTAINYLINEKHVPVGGTSAGMAVLGSIINTAQNGGVTSEGALADPYNDYVNISNEYFIDEPILKNIITDTHYDNPDRKGRHVAFIARSMKDYAVLAKGIACEEYTAICIDERGIATVYGDHEGQDFAYFVQANCAMPNDAEICRAGVPLTWDRGHQAIKVYKVAGNNTGSNTFDLNDWISGTGGTWQDWYVINGVLKVNANGSAPDCSIVGTDNTSLDQKIIKVTPSITQDIVTISLPSKSTDHAIIITNTMGQVIYKNDKVFAPIQINVSQWQRGLYFVHLAADNSKQSSRFVKE